MNWLSRLLTITFGPGSTPILRTLALYGKAIDRDEATLETDGGFVIRDTDGYFIEITRTGRLLFCGDDRIAITPMERLACIVWRRRLLRRIARRNRTDLMDLYRARVKQWHNADHPTA